MLSRFKSRNGAANLFQLLQVLLENTSESDEDSDFTLSVSMVTNQEGLRIFVGGQAIAGELVFGGFPFGSHKVVVQVFRGPNYYDYSNMPITLNWNSLCDSGVIFSSLQLKPTFLQPCAKVEFHTTIQTFAIDDTYVYNL